MLVVYWRAFIGSLWVLLLNVCEYIFFKLDIQFIFYCILIRSR